MTAEQMLGKRYACDFRVLSIVDNVKAALLLRGALFTLSNEELEALVNSGLVVEVADGFTTAAATPRQEHP